MSDGDIALDREYLEQRLKDLEGMTTAMTTALKEIPGTPDAGSASLMMAFITVAGAEATSMAAVIYDALTSITHQVIEDATATEDEIRDVFSTIESGLDEL